MKLSYDWMNDFVDFSKFEIEDIIKVINTSICEIDSADPYFAELETVIAAKVESLERHPDADKLQIVQLNIGKKTTTVVSGAPNLKTGMIVPLALPGTRLGEKEIQSAKLRGVQSDGMLCSAKELGLSEDASGVLDLGNASLGESLRKLYGFEDIILDIDNKSITHRPDLWSHFGFARELASQMRLPIRFNPFDSKYEESDVDLPEVVPSEYAHSYYAVRIENLSIAPSSKKIKSRLEKCGVRAINNVVDVSNYVMLEMGQPTHFFDTEKLGKISIQVDVCRAGESIALLDGTEKKLESGQTIIRNGKLPVALAGIMGGSESAIQEDSKSAILESAVFPRERIRKSIRQSGLRTEAAVRYEKGLDPSSTLPVIARSVQLLKENGQSDLRVSQPAGFNHHKGKSSYIYTSIDFLSRKLGRSIELVEVKDILERLHFKVTEKDKELIVEVPSFRQNYDVTIPEDLVEEIGRTLGYDTFPINSLFWEIETPIQNHSRRWERRLKNAFVSHFRGTEMVNYSFSSSEDNTFEGEVSSIRILNEMGEEANVMRATPYPAILHNLRLNQDRFDSARLFEFARVFEKDPSGQHSHESKWLVWAAFADRKGKEKDLALAATDFIELRELLTETLSLTGIHGVNWEKTSRSYLHPNGAIELDWRGKIAGEMGFFHPAVLDRYDLKKRIIGGKLDIQVIEDIFRESSKPKAFQPPSVFPQDQIDLSLVMPDNETTDRFSSLVLSQKIPEIRNIWVHDIFRGGNLSEGMKSVTYRIQLLPIEHTFTQEEVHSISQKLIQLAESNQFELRR